MTNWTAHLGRVPDRDTFADDLHALSRGGIDLETILFLRDSPVWSGRSFDEAFPGLSRISSPGPLEPMSVRAQNALRNRGVRDWADLASLTPALIWSIPNLGVKTLRDILECATTRWAQETLSGNTGRPYLNSEFTEGAVMPETPRSRLIASLVSVVDWAWEATGSPTVGEALTAAEQHPERLPAGVAAALADLMSSSSSAILGRTEPSEEMWAEYAEFSDRERFVLEERVLAEGKRRTLDALGSELGVTRERIRQIEAHLRRSLERRRAEMADLGHLLARVTDRCPAVTQRAALDELILRTVSESSQPSTSTSELALRSRLLAHALPERRDVGGWSVTVEVDERIAELRDHLRSSDDLEVDDLVRVAVDEITAVAPEFEEPLLQELGLRRIGTNVVQWPRTQNDRAYVVLREEGDTMSMFDLQQHADPSANPRSFAQRVQTDPRIMRRGRDRYGLRTWGGEEYSGIMDELEQAIERAGGRIDLDETVESFVREFDVSETSVRSYAGNRRFQKFPDGTLGFREADGPTFDPSRHPVELAARCYRLDGIWHLRQLVTADTLRGSGAQLRTAPALGFGLEPDLTFPVDFDGHSVTLTWMGNQPSIGALRALAQHHGCQEGDLLFLPMDGEEPRGAFSVRGSEVALMAPEQRLAKEMGLVSTDPEEDDAFDVADAIGLPPGADWFDIAVRLEERREPELAVLIPTSWRR